MALRFLTKHRCNSYHVCLNPFQSHVLIFTCLMWYFWFDAIKQSHTSDSFTTSQRYDQKYPTHLRVPLNPHWNYIYNSLNNHWYFQSSISWWSWRTEAEQKIKAHSYQISEKVRLTSSILWGQKFRHSVIRIANMCDFNKGQNMLWCFIGRSR